MSTTPSPVAVRRIQFIGRSIFVVGMLVAAAAWLWPTAQNTTSRHRQADASTDEQLVSLTHAQRDRQPNNPTDHATKPIEQITVGERVLARNPEVSDEERSGWVEPDWSDWLQVSLVMPKDDGSELKIELLRSEDWVRSQLEFIVDEKADAELHFAPRVAPTSEIAEQVLSVPLSPLRPIFRDVAMADLVIEEAGLELVGLAAEMDLPELAITGPAVVIDLQPAPPVTLGQGRVVTATFHHSSGDVIDLTIGDATSSETIGTTGNHPFWSEDRQEYVQAATLEIGEQVRTHAGDTKRVVDLLPRPGPQAVFNLEVHGEHVYYVGDGGVLVHNAGPSYVINSAYRSGWDDAFSAPNPGGTFNRRSVIEGFQDHHIISDKNVLTKNHELLDAADFSLQSRKNKIFLPTEASLHPTRSIHLGRHRTSVSRNLAEQMDQVLDVGRQQGFTTEQYNQALRALISEERQLLRSGQRALNKNARPGAQ